MTTGSSAPADAVMRDLEQVVFTVLSLTGLHRPVAKLLRSEAAWRLSGITLPTAIFATTGSWGSIPTYIGSMEVRWSHFTTFLPPRPRVLDFGTGLGGNLFGLARRIRSGVGVDVNPHYLRYAARIARSHQMPHLSFAWYNGTQLPELGRFDLTTSIGAFERIPKRRAREYLAQIATMMEPSGRLILYFLSTEARNRGFGRLLGPNAYVFWEETELVDAFDAAGLAVRGVVRGYPTAGDTYILDLRHSATT